MKWLMPGFLLLLFATSGVGCVGSTEELGVLSSLAKDAGKQDRVVKEETERYQAVLEAVHEGKLKAEMSKNEVMEEYGDPVIVLSRRNGEALVYKHGDATWFDSRKVYLFFDTTGRYVKALAPGKEDVATAKS